MNILQHFWTQYVWGLENQYPYISGVIWDSITDDLGTIFTCYQLGSSPEYVSYKRCSTFEVVKVKENV